MELSKAHQIVVNMKEEENHKTAKLFLAFVQVSRPKTKTEIKFREISIDYAWDFLTRIDDKSDNENNFIYPGNPFDNKTELDNFVKDEMVNKGIVERKDESCIEYYLNVDTFIDKYNS